MLGLGTIPFRLVTRDGDPFPITKFNMKKKEHRERRVIVDIVVLIVLRSSCH